MDSGPLPAGGLRVANKYELKMTKGALALARHWESDPDRPTRPPLGGGGVRAGLPGPSTKGRVSTRWSERSRRHMRFEFGALPWERLGRRPAMITLTYPGDWDLWVPDSRTLHRHREALKERWRRRFGTPIGVWVTEFQKRGAPHLHLYVGLPDEVSEAEYEGLQRRTIARRHAEVRLGPWEARRRQRAPRGEFAMWLRTAWWEVVGSELKRHHGRGVDIATAFFSEQAEQQANRVRVAEYFWRESGKWAQKQPPAGFGSMRFYGRWGQREGFEPVVGKAELDELVALELRRMLRRMRLGKMREAAKRTGRKVRPGSGRSRGRDGLVVFGVDGTVIGPRLIACAREIAIEKAARRAQEPSRVLRDSRWVARAFSELEVSDTPVDLFDDDWSDVPFDDERDELYEEYLADVEERERQLVAAMEARVAAQDRERRRAIARREDGWAGARSARGRTGGRRRATGPPEPPGLSHGSEAGTEAS